MKILVLGGTGAMGKELVPYLAKTDNEIFATTRNHKLSSKQNIKYLTGNAQEDSFIYGLLCKEHFDAIVDFMNYSTAVFSKRVSLLLNGTSQYVFLSSSRVYAETDNLITESSKLLIDACGDKNYVDSDEYAIAKARQERLLINSGYSNWTIVRPYITYGEERLQLGFMEKELWLYRLLCGRSLLIGRDICERVTTLTSGKLVSRTIAKMLGNPNCLGQTYNIVQSNSIKWEDVLYAYTQTFEKVTGIQPHIIFEDSSQVIGKVCGRLEQIKYDRLYNRAFDPTRAIAINPELGNPHSVVEELKLLLEKFLKSEKHFKEIDWRSEGYMDKKTHELSQMCKISGDRNKVKYLVARFSPYYELRRDNRYS